MAVAVLTRHEPSKPDSRLRCRVVAIRDSSSSYSSELYHLGFSKREVSGRRDRGGPGHRVAAAWVVPKSRWDNDPILRAQVAVLFARVNGGPSSDLLKAKEHLAALLKAKEYLAALLAGKRQEDAG